jgi:hypothetical protein
MPRLPKKWNIALKVLPFAVGAVAIKYALHLLGWEAISLNPLFSGLLAATVFLLGFLLSGVLSDYKESEKLPAELAVSLSALVDEASILYRGKRAPEARALLKSVTDLGGTVIDWFYKRVRSPQVLDGIAGLNAHFLAIEPLTTANFVVRMKQEQSALRRTFIRIRMIRDTSFVASGYAIAEIISILLITGFLLSKIDPFYESLFFVGLITFFLTYMLALIKDLDDPFEYGPGGGDADEVSLLPIEEARARAAQEIASIDGNA